MGNRQTRTVTGVLVGNGNTLTNGTATFTYDANDRITSGGHTYDNDGNETTVAGKTASYDFENHLVGLSSGGTLLASYIYDADGNRYSAYNSAATPTTTTYVVDTSLPYASVVEEYTGTTPTLSARYDYGDDLIRMDRGSGVYYYIYDGLGSTRQLVTTSGTPTDTYAYDAFGEQAGKTGGTANPFLFNAQQFDQASGDYYLRARYYDQTSGRFISQDPLTGSDEDPITLHRYLYASDDPFDRIDPSGQGDSDSLIGLSAGLAVAAPLIAQNLSVVQEVGVSVISAIDPDAGFGIAATLPQTEGGAELGASANSIFRKSGSILYEQFQEAVAAIEKSGIGTKAQQAFEEFAQIRRSLNLPSVGGFNGNNAGRVEGTLAKLEIAGEEYYGKSAHKQDTSRLSSNLATRVHAEGDVFRQALNDGVPAGEDAILYTDRDLCGWCGVGLNSVGRPEGAGIRSLGRDLKLNSLTIYEPYGPPLKITDFTRR